MAKGRFKADKKPDKKKVIEIEVEGQVMTITREDGKDPDVKNGIPGLGDLNLDKLPDDTVIFTHTNPTCGYYYWNGRWWYL
jgi:hypothetical protein